VPKDLFFLRTSCFFRRLHRDHHDRRHLSDHDYDRRRLLSDCVNDLHHLNDRFFRHRHHDLRVLDLGDDPYL
jgi:hypothetical protein